MTNLFTIDCLTCVNFVIVIIEHASHSNFEITPHFALRPFLSVRNPRERREHDVSDDDGGIDEKQKHT